VSQKLGRSGRFGGDLFARTERLQLFLIYLRMLLRIAMLERDTGQI